MYRFPPSHLTPPGLNGQPWLLGWFAMQEPVEWLAVRGTGWVVGRAGNRLSGWPCGEPVEWLAVRGTGWVVGRAGNRLSGWPCGEPVEWLAVRGTGWVVGRAGNRLSGWPCGEPVEWLAVRGTGWVVGRAGNHAQAVHVICCCPDPRLPPCWAGVRRDHSADLIRRLGRPMGTGDTLCRRHHLGAATLWGTNSEQDDNPRLNGAPIGIKPTSSGDSYPEAHPSDGSLDRLLQ